MYKRQLLGNVGGALKSPFSIAKDVVSPIGKGHLFKSGGGLQWKPDLDWARDINLGGALPWRWDFGGAIPKMRERGSGTMGREQYRQGVGSGNIGTHFSQDAKGDGFAKRMGMGLLGMLGAAAAGAGGKYDNPFEEDPEPFEYDMFGSGGESGAQATYDYYDE